MPNEPSPQRAWVRGAVTLFAYGLIMVLGHFAGQWLQQHMALSSAGGPSAATQAALLTGLLIYVILLALPFVPGIEISLALFAAFGAKVALPIYIATLVALTVSYTAGRVVSLKRLAAFFDFLGLTSASAMVRRLGPMTPKQRIETLVENAPGRLSRYLVRYRDLALIASLNLPGNALIGGGGGIALLAGMSGVFPPWRFLAAIAVASAPIPLAVALAGLGWR